MRCEKYAINRGGGNACVTVKNKTYNNMERGSPYGEEEKKTVVSDIQLWGRVNSVVPMLNWYHDLKIHNVSTLSPTGPPGSRKTYWTRKPSRR